MTVCVRLGKTVTECSGSDTIELKREQTQPVPFLFPQVSAIAFFPFFASIRSKDGISAKNY
jgi:hypothetical protein